MDDVPWARGVWVYGWHVSNTATWATESVLNPLPVLG